MKTRSKLSTLKAEEILAELEARKRIEENIRRAEQLVDPLSDFEYLTSFEIDPDSTSRRVTSNDNGSDGTGERPSRSFRIEFHRSPLPTDVLNECVGLFRTNMSTLYRSSSWGLDVPAKEAELRYPGARFLIVRETSIRDDDETKSSSGDARRRDATIAAFSHFRFEPNDDDAFLEEVMYVYEIQVRSDARSLGLGKRCMSLMELVALRARMRRVMLTVFKSNAVAMSFYTKRMRYEIDESSPSNFEGEEVDYEVLSKKLVK